MASTKTALVIGATGLVGGQLLRQLLDSPDYATVIALVRRPIDWQHPKLQQIIFDFDHPDPEKVTGDDLYCAMGTTLKKAGSKEAQYRIDCLYPYEVGKIARLNGFKQYLLVSSVGADAGSSNFYLRTKGELEQKLRDLAFDTFISARPSILFGEREESRPAEKIGIALAKGINGLLVGPWRKYRGIEAATVAKALIRLASQGLNGTHYVESDQLQELGG